MATLRSSAAGMSKSAQPPSDHAHVVNPSKVTGNCIMGSACGLVMLFGVLFVTLLPNRRMTSIVTEGTLHTGPAPAFHMVERASPIPPPPALFGTRPDKGCWETLDLPAVASPPLRLCGSEGVSSSLNCTYTPGSPIPPTCWGQNVHMNFAGWKQATTPPFGWAPRAPGTISATCHMGPHPALPHFAKAAEEVLSMWGPLELPGGVPMPGDPPVVLAMPEVRGNAAENVAASIGGLQALHAAGVLDLSKDGNMFQEDIAVCPTRAVSAPVPFRLPWWGAQPGADCTPFSSMAASIVEMEEALVAQVEVLYTGAVPGGDMAYLLAVLANTEQDPSAGWSAPALVTAGHKRAFPLLVFAPTVQESPVYADTSLVCRKPLQSFRAFRRLVLHRLGFQHSLPAPALKVPPTQRGAPVGDSVTATLLVSMDNTAPGAAGGLTNLQEVLDSMRETGAFRKAELHIEAVDPTRIGEGDVLQIMARSDMVVGVGSAGLDAVVFLPPWAGVFQLLPPGTRSPTPEQRMSQWAGAIYGKWTAPGTAGGNSAPLQVPIGDFRNGFGDILQAVQHRRMDYVRQAVAAKKQK